MKKPVAILICCASLAPLAFAQPSSNRKKQGTGSTEAVTVTGTIIKMTIFWRPGRRPIISRSRLSLFARIVRILREVMFSADLVTF